MRFMVIVLGLWTGCGLWVSSAAAGPVLDAVRKRGSLICGLSQGLTGFSAPDAKGVWRGLEVDICRAVGVAIFGTPKKVKTMPMSAQQRFAALQAGDVDLLLQIITRTLSRDTALGFNFGPTSYYDGQGILVKKSAGLKSVKELRGASICVMQGTTTERNLADYFRTHKIPYKLVVMDEADTLFRAFMSGRCDAFTTDKSQLAVERVKAKKPDSLQILPETLSKEPLAPVLRHGDDEFFDIVTWSFYALVAAEELGVSSKNLVSMLKSSNPRVRRLLGVIKGNGKALGLDERWAYNIIQHVGHYGEIFERHLGQQSPFKLKRGLNNLWTKGGLMYAPPLR